MTQDMRVALITSLQDRLVAPLRRSLDEVEKEFKDLERTLGGVGKSAEQAQQKMERMRGPKDAAREAAALAKETERAIGLARRLQAAWSAAGNTIRAATAVVGAAAAVRAVTAPALGQARSYEYSLANAANTAFAGQSVQARSAGMGSLDAAVRQAVMAGGGTRDDALAALNSMIGSGTVDVGAAARMLPMIQRAATGAGASADQLGSIVVRALQNGFREADIPLLLDKALAAGQAGGFELRDMAKWLPQVLAIAGQSGMRGPRDIDRLLAATQASVITAGTRDEAGNNLVNLLAKINSQDTANDAKKLGIDLSGSLAAARSQGVDSLSAFTNLASQIAGRDPRFVAARRAADAAGTEGDRKAALESQAAILQGSAIGKIVQDRQALMALIAVMNNGTYMESVQARLANARGANDANMSLLEQMPAFQVQRAEQVKLFAQGDALGGVNKALGRLAETTATVYEKHPLLSQALEAAKVAAYGLAAAAGAASGVLMLLGGKGLLAAGGAAAGGAGAAGAAAAGATAGGLAPAVAAAARAGVLLPGMGLAGAGTATAGAASLPILGAGMLMSERMNSVQGLQSRIATRNERLRELTELAALDPQNAVRYGNEIATLKASLAELQSRLDARAPGGHGVENLAVNVYLDGQQIQSAVNRRNTMDARRN